MAYSAFQRTGAWRLFLALAAAGQLCAGTALADVRGVALGARGAACDADASTSEMSALDRMRHRQDNVGEGAPSPASAGSEGCRAPVGVGGEDDGGALDAASLLSGKRDTVQRAGEVLGSVAVPVGRTAYDARWARVDAAAPANLMRGALAQAGVAAGMEEAELLRRVNRWVNQQVQYQSDQQLYKQQDHWATAAETLARKAGDCEDYAVLKMQMLRAAGIPSARLKLMLLRDLAANADHAFLIVSGKAGDQILDNMTDGILNARQMVAVRPVVSFSGERRWLHALPDRGGAMMAKVERGAVVGG